MNFLQSLAKAIAIPVAFIAPFFGFHLQAPQSAPVPATQTLGAYNPSGGGTYRLSGSIGTTNTTITLSSFKEPVSNTPYTMAYLNSTIVFGTLDPQTNVSEFISFTGITQNSDGSATLTGVTRGLNRTNVSDVCSSSNVFKQPHSGQSIFILSNSPCLYGQYVTKVNDETISGIKTFASTTIPKVASDTTLAQVSASSTNFATVGFVTSTAFGSTTVAIGSGGTGTTSLPFGVLAGAGTGPITATSSPTFQSLYSGNVYVTSTSSLAGTTSIAASQLNNIVLNNVPYSFPGVRAASGTVLTEDGTGRLAFAPNVSSGYASGRTTANSTSTGGFSVTFTHNLGSVPRLFVLHTTATANNCTPKNGTVDNGAATAIGSQSSSGLALPGTSGTFTLISQSSAIASVYCTAASSEDMWTLDQLTTTVARITLTNNIGGSTVQFQWEAYK